MIELLAIIKIPGFAGMIFQAFFKLSIIGLRF
jgi:hypothetical protein